MKSETGRGVDADYAAGDDSDETMAAGPPRESTELLGLTAGDFAAR